MLEAGTTQGSAKEKSKGLITCISVILFPPDLELPYLFVIYPDPVPKFFFVSHSLCTYTVNQPKVCRTR
jgi:hypothetical protein